MGVMPDTWIKKMAATGMIAPFESEQVRMAYDHDAEQLKPVVSYGLTSYGYDMRLGDVFKVFKKCREDSCPIIDPKEFNPEIVMEVTTPAFVMPPHSFVLGHSLEYFRIPRETLAICIGKSTYARCGLVVNITPLEPGWEGQVTIELANTTDLPLRVYANEGIAQVFFLHASVELSRGSWGDYALRPQVCEMSYEDRNGRYQRQRGVTLPR